MSGYVTLSWGDLAAASVFLLINAGLSLWRHLGIERKLLFSAARMVVQLLLVGLVLKTVFAIRSPWLTALVALVMLAVAAREIRARQERPLAGVWGWSVGGGAMAMAGIFVASYGLIAAIGTHPWWTPRFALPLLGMILGNIMTGVSLGLEGLLGALRRERVAVEARLLLGHSRAEAFRPQVRRALQAGFTPIINGMAATGVVSLPGMMSGQILSGVDPTEAVKYQLLVMFLIGGATGLGVLLAVTGAAWRMSDDRHRLRLDRLSPTRRRD
ncbi:MAG: iron export ABC transporter permease subunit FetB [Rhodobacterales bacterium]|nr:MAG: iron export ABC transporter permease subunit FetB [Rhodobacterales bacterium]